MWLSPALGLFSLSIFLSVFLVISSSSLFICWLGLELNTLVFVPFLMMIKSKSSSEAAIKYFLTQTLASILFILSLLGNLLDYQTLFCLVSLMVAMSIKLGGAPFHSWLLSIASSCSWSMLMILLTIQKINPLMVMWISDGLEVNLIYFVVIFSVVVGGFMGLIQTDPRLILTFSSINHVGWLLLSLVFSLWMGVVYFLFYFVILLSIVMIFSKLNFIHLNQFSLSNFSSMSSIVLFSSLLSLGGLPPFLGFLPKWMVLKSLILGEFYLMSLLLIVMSLFTLYYYLRLTFSAFILSKSIVYHSKSNSFWDLTSVCLLAVSFLGLPLILFI
uniref:NADH-ubiquinone oxidoreductase chain 2 n=1 Tax=Simocephalus sibiricus TaxID=1472266 RepID=A0A8E6TSH6_9CRUS|nr:NADH dehydrogenase subunit 2 [Simocephalus sibiricus]